MLKKERNYQFRERMLEVHRKHLRDFTLKVENDEFEIEEGILIAIGKDADVVVETAAKDFNDYLMTSMEIGGAVSRKSDVSGAINVKIADTSVDMTGADSTKGFRIETSADGITVFGFDARGCAQGLYYLEKCMTVRKAPFIKYGTVTKKPLFSPQMVHSGFGIDNYPNEHLAQIAHDGRDAILLFVKGVDMTTCGYCDFNELVYRASKYGIDVYMYSYLSAKMHPEDDGAEEYYDSLYGSVFRQCPGFKGVILVESSLHFPTKDTRDMGDYSLNASGRRLSGENPCYDMPLYLNAVKNAIRKYNKDAELVVWTYTAQRHGEESRREWIKQIPKDATVLITYDKNCYYTNKAGARCYAPDYTLSCPGPAEKFVTDIKFAHSEGYKVYAMANTGGLTWDMGVMPYQPGAQLWKKRYDELIKFNKEYGLAGIMESHHYGFFPSVISKYSNEIFRAGDDDHEKLLDMCIVHEFGDKDIDKIKEALQCMSDSNECYTSNGIEQCGPLRVGAAYPLNIKLDLNLPTASYAHFGNIYVTPKYETERAWQLKYRLFSELTPEEIKSWEKATEYAIEGIKILESIENPNENLERLILLCKYIKCQCISSINAKKWYLKKLEIDSAKAGDVPKIVADMRAIADEEIKNAEEAINYTDYDSRLGWEPSMEYIADSDHIRWKINMLKKVAQADLDEYLKAAEMEFLL